MVIHKPAGFGCVQAVNAGMIWHVISHFCSSLGRLWCRWNCSSAVEHQRSTFLWQTTMQRQKGCLPIKDAIRTRDMPNNSTQHSGWQFAFPALLSAESSYLLNGRGELAREKYNIIWWTEWLAEVIVSVPLDGGTTASAATCGAMDFRWSFHHRLSTMGEEQKTQWTRTPPWTAKIMCNTTEHESTNTDFSLSGCTAKHLAKK